MNLVSDSMLPRQGNCLSGLYCMNTFSLSAGCVHAEVHVSLPALPFIQVVLKLRTSGMYISGALSEQPMWSAE